MSAGHGAGNSPALRVSLHEYVVRTERQSWNSKGDAASVASPRQASDHLGAGSSASCRELSCCRGQVNRLIPFGREIVIDRFPVVVVSEKQDPISWPGVVRGRHRIH